MTVTFKWGTHSGAAKRSKCKSLNANVPKEPLPEACVKYLVELFTKDLQPLQQLDPKSFLQQMESMDHVSKEQVWQIFILPVTNTVLNSIWLLLATLASSSSFLHTPFTPVSPRCHAVSYLCMDWFLSFPYSLTVHGAKEGNFMSEVDWMGFGTNWRVLTVSKEEATAQSQPTFVMQECRF